MLRNSPIQQRNRGTIFKLRIRIPELDKIDLAVRRSPIKICNVDVHFQSTRQRGHLNVVYNTIDARAGEMRLRQECVSEKSRTRFFADSLNKVFAELASTHRFPNFWMEQERRVLIRITSNLGRRHKS